MRNSKGQFVKGSRPSVRTEFKKGYTPWHKENGHLFHGKKNGNWRGGRIKKNTGYFMLRKYGHPTADSTGYVLEHRYVMEQHIGRLLKKSEVVHHINHKRDDNRIENLLLFASHSEHRIYELKSK